MLGLSVAVALLLSFLASLPREGRFASRILAGGNRVGGSLRKQRLQRALVVVQVAVSVVLLAGAGLLTRTMMRLSDVDTGLRTEEVLTMQVLLLTTDILTNPASDGAAKEKLERMRREIAALPGVIEVGVGSPMPLRSADVRFDVKTEVALRPSAKRCRTPSFAPRTRSSSAPREYRCFAGAHSNRPTGRGRAKS